MKSVIASAVTAFLLAGCGPGLTKLNADALQLVAPDVPAIPPETQKAAADEIDGGKCPALSDVADACLITRDEARLLLSRK